MSRKTKAEREAERLQARLEAARATAKKVKEKVTESKAVIVRRGTNFGASFALGKGFLDFVPEVGGLPKTTVQTIGLGLLGAGMAHFLENSGGDVGEGLLDSSVALFAFSSGQRSQVSGARHVPARLASPHAVPLPPRFDDDEEDLAEVPRPLVISGM